MGSDLPGVKKTYNMRGKSAIKNVVHLILAILLTLLFVGATRIHQNESRPNILFIMNDDMSWVDFGAYGCKVVKTPVFDELAQKGVLFRNAFSTAPNCSASRASILTGRYPCELEEAGTHNSYFPGKFKVYQDLLEENGYQTGYTGKGWSPGNYEILGWNHNPAGPEYNDILFDKVPYTGLHEIDIASNFREFLKTRDKTRPFSMWIGSREPHGPREVGSGIKAGMNPDDVVVPGFLPDTPDMRSQLLDYYLEIEWFDKQLGIIMEELEKSGELDNTLVVVTSDNGMPFPRAKTQLYEYGTHMAMLAAWPSSVKPGRKVEDLVNFVDLAPTFLEVAGLTVPEEMSGQSFQDILLSDKEGRIDPQREVLYTCHERHDHQRYDNLGYPMRAIRDYQFLYIRNFRTERWPLGNPDVNGARGRYPDTPEGQRLFELTYTKKPAEELYDIDKDPYCLTNLASESKYKEVKDNLRNRLDNKMIALKDPRMLGYGDIFDSYPRNSLRMIPEIGGFKEPRTYNLKYRIDKPVIKTYPLPPVYPPSSTYSLEVNGINIPVTEFVVKNKIQYHYAQFSIAGNANVRIRLKDAVRSYLIRPLPFEVSAEAIGNYLNFTLTEPRYLIIDVNDHEKLILLADPLEKDIPITGTPGITSILDYNVDQTGQSESTLHIQKAIDQISLDGGGTLYFPPGIYKTRTVFVRDNVNIYLAGGSVIRGTGEKTDYPEYDPGKLKSITYVFKIEDVSNVKIYGRGTIDGLGVQLAGNVDNINDAPLKIRAVSTHNSNNITVEGIVARELTSWAVPFFHSDHIKASHVKVLDYLHLKNSDGINMCASQYGLVENCFVMVGDDSYCAKGHEGEPTHDIVFKNSVAWSSTRGVTLGMQAYAHMYNIFYDSIFIAGTRDGIDFKHNDGPGDWEDIIVKNIFVDECWGKPFNMHIREGGSIKNVIIENYTCKSTGNKSFIKGLDSDSKISNVSIGNMILNGGKVTSSESGNFEINRFTSHISFH